MTESTSNPDLRLSALSKPEGSVASPLHPQGTMVHGLGGVRSGPRSMEAVAWTTVVVGAVALLLVIVGWTHWIAPNLEPKRFGIVQAGQVYRSGETTPAGLKSIVQAHGIKTVIDLGAHEPGSPEETLAQRTAEALGITRYRFDLEGDATGDPDQYAQALRLMTNPELQPVLVHCAAGSQRTGCAIAMYRQIENGWTLEEAYEESFLYDHDPDDEGTHVRTMLERWTWPVEVALRTGSPVRRDAQ